jgi:hypothetical protein
MPAPYKIFAGFRSLTRTPYLAQRGTPDGGGSLLRRDFGNALPDRSVATTVAAPALPTKLGADGSGFALRRALLLRASTQCAAPASLYTYYRRILERIVPSQCSCFPSTMSPTPTVAPDRSSSS